MKDNIFSRKSKILILSALAIFAVSMLLIKTPFEHLGEWLKLLLIPLILGLVMSIPFLFLRKHQVPGFLKFGIGILLITILMFVGAGGGLALLMILAVAGIPLAICFLIFLILSVRHLKNKRNTKHRKLTWILFIIFILPIFTMLISYVHDFF